MYHLFLWVSKQEIKEIRKFLLKYDDVFIENYTPKWAKQIRIRNKKYRKRMRMKKGVSLEEMEKFLKAPAPKKRYKLRH